VKLSDPTHGLKQTSLEQVALTGEDLKAYESFWDRSAQADHIKAIADQDDEQSFELSGANVAAELVPLIGKDAKVLEIGCGAGRIMQHMAPHCLEVHGADISAEMVARGAERLKLLPHVSFHHGNGYDLGEFEDSTFDLVYSDIAFQHMPKTVAFNYMREAYRVLNASGRFRLQVPNLLEEEHWRAFNHFTQPYFVQHPYPMNFYTPAEVALMLTSAGFWVERMTNDVVVLARKSGGPGIAPDLYAQVQASARADLLNVGRVQPKTPLHRAARRAAGRIKRRVKGVR
jgi:SAM-dependent methyltransferase